MSKPIRRILVIGRSGQLARAIGSVLIAEGRDVEHLSRPHHDLRDPHNFTKAIRAAEPDLVINCAALTNVDEAESDPRQSLLVNASGAQSAARGAAAANASIIHFSTDYVFDGNKGAPYIEGDTPNPSSVYGKSKFAGDILVASANPAHVILRTAWVCSPWGRNFVRTIMRLAHERTSLSVVNDQTGSPSFAYDIAMCVSQIIDRLEEEAKDRRHFGLFNVVNDGEATWYDLARATMRWLAARGEVSVDVLPIPSRLYPTRARRPAYSVLSTTKLKSVYGICMRPWEEALHDCLDSILAEGISLAPSEMPLA